MKAMVIYIQMTKHYTFKNSFKNCVFSICFSFVVVVVVAVVAVFVEKESWQIYNQRRKYW